MKTKFLPILLLFIGLSTKAQNYEFTLIQNSDYNYTVAAIADYNSGAMDPNLDQYGFTIMLQDGASIDQAGTSFAEGGSAGTFTVFDAATLDASDPGHDRSATIVSMPTGVDALPAHTSGQIIPLVTFDVLGSPTSGEISIIDNSDPLSAAAGGQFNSFLLADSSGGNSYSDLYSGQSGTTSFNFATLSNQREELIGASLYPNPTLDNVSIKGVNNLQSVEVMNVNGQRVMNFNGNLETISLNNLNSGVYFVKLQTEKASKTIKLIKK